MNLSRRIARRWPVLFSMREAVGMGLAAIKVTPWKDVPQIIPMELVRVSKESLGSWARQLKAWGFEVDSSYTARP